MFTLLAAATENKIDIEKKKTKLDEKKVVLAACLEDTNMLTMRMDELDADAVMIIHTIRVRMLEVLGGGGEGGSW